MLFIAQYILLSYLYWNFFESSFLYLRTEKRESFYKVFAALKGLRPVEDLCWRKDKTSKEIVAKEKCDKGGAAEDNHYALAIASCNACFVTEGTEHSLQQWKGGRRVVRGEEPELKLSLGNSEKTVFSVFKCVIHFLIAELIIKYLCSLATRDTEMGTNMPAWNFRGELVRVAGTRVLLCYTGRRKFQ